MKFDQLIQQLLEQNTLTDDAVRMADNVFRSAYGDWTNRQNELASNKPYETTADVRITVVTEHDEPVPVDHLETFKPTVSNGTVRRINISRGQKNPDIDPWLSVDVKYVARSQQPTITIASPLYATLDTVTVHAVQGNIQDAKVRVTRK